MKRIALFFSGWMICGIIAAGFTNAYFARKYDLCQGRNELSFAIGFGVAGGPIAMGISLMTTGFGEYGWSLNILQNPACQPKKVLY